MSVFLCQNFLASWSSVTIAILLWTLLWIPASPCLFVCVMLNVQTRFIDHALAIHFLSAVGEFLKFPPSFLNWIWRLEMTKCLYHVHKINLQVYRPFCILRDRMGSLFLMAVHFCVLPPVQHREHINMILKYVLNSLHVVYAYSGGIWIPVYNFN